MAADRPNPATGQASANVEADPSFRLAICATFTVEPIAGVLVFWAAELGWHCDLEFAPYNQVFQQLLDSSGVLAGNRSGVNLVLVRLEDWVRFGTATAAGLADLEEHCTQFLSAIRAAAGRLPAPLVVALCPPSPAFMAEPSRREFYGAAERRIAGALAALPTVHLVTAGELERLYPVAEPHDPHADELGHVPYTAEFFAGLGTLLMRKVHALRTPPYKAIVLDCDNTLWKGVCGEDGPRGIELDPPRRALQEFMLEQHAAGRLLCLASKNNPEDVLDTFRLNPDMPLRLEHFAARRIDWESKAAGMAALAEELDLGLASFILLDDNPKECGEVEAGHPDMLALALPADPEIPDFLRHVWAFDHVKTTAVDRERTALYAQQAERGRARAQAASLEEFLESLRLEIRIAPLAPHELPRAAQLTQRTNQMNFTTVRRSESEIQALAASGAAECLMVHVRDRFGDYGLTGLIIFSAAAPALRVDTFLLSCRVLGRGVEHRMLAHLGGMARGMGLAGVEVPFSRTPRNLPALLFLESVGLEFQSVENGELSFRFPAVRAEGVRYQPGRAAPVRFEAAVPPPSANGSKRIPYARIASELRTPRQILARIRGARPGAAALAGPFPDGRASVAIEAAETEPLLARIWAETLGIDAVAPGDDFFDLGGHSLLAVQLMSRVRREFAVELSLELVYSGAFTVAALADAIVLKRMERSGAGAEYDALLREMDSLSDEQVRELLAREDEMPLA